MAQVSATYSSGDRPVASWSGGTATCYTDLTVTLPLGAEITGVDLAYTITANGDAYKSEQRSRVFSPTLSNGETSWTPGQGNDAGAMAYSRSGILSFNGEASGDVVFRLEAYRTWSSSGQSGQCSTVDQTITNGTYTVIVYYTVSTEAIIKADAIFSAAELRGSMLSAAVIKCNPLFNEHITKAIVLADSLFGDALVFAQAEGQKARIKSDAIFNDAQLVAAYSRADILAGALFSDAKIRGDVRPPAAPPIPSGVTLYYCLLTGAPDGIADAVLPIKSFSVRHREQTASYYQIVIPSLEYVDVITARPNGQIVIWSDTDGTAEELMRGSLGDVRSDRGPNSQAITISGNASRAATPLATYTVTDVIYQYSTFDGEQRLRIKPRAGIRPGDTIRYGGTYFVAGLVSWSVSVSASGISAQMEVATLAESV